MMGMSETRFGTTAGERTRTGRPADHASPRCVSRVAAPVGA
ncbi:hypothetical protein BIWAKO_00225 [Bosea sp. BIWAKO-01]|nr:hypothetical protein BIWAKO_00225 [Bosea sp. BIWAKO-01]